MYRNGTTGIELLELIKEKDIEIKEHLNVIEDKTSTIQKLAKSSSEVLAKCQSLSVENASLVNDKSLLEKLLKQRELEIEKYVIQQASLREKIAVQHDEINRLTNELATRFDDISRLQERCAKLVTEKQEKSRTYDSDIHALSKKYRAAQVNHCTFPLLIWFIGVCLG